MEHYNPIFSKVPTLRFSNKTIWEKKRIKDFCEVNPKTEELEDEFIYIDLESVSKGCLLSKNIISKTNAPSRAQRVLTNNDILFQCVRPYQMNNLLFNAENTDFQYVASTGYAQIRTQENPSFVYHLLHSPNFNKEVMLRCTGSSYPAITSSDLGDIEVYICGVGEQQKIGHFLDLIDRRIAVQNKIIEDLKVLKKELCAKLFGSPLCGRIIAIEQVADIYGGYAFNSKAYVNKGKYKIVTIGNVTGDKYISGNYNTIDRLPNNIQKPQVLSKGDILVSLTGNVGRISIVDGDEYLLNQRVAKLGIEDDLTKEYIYQYLSNSSFEKDMINAGQGAAQKNIKNQDILSYCIRFPTDQTALENIDKLLSLYDMRITSEKAILSNLILQKSYYLRAMFI